MSSVELVITTELVKGHLRDMGYDPKTLSEEALQEFVKELQEIYLDRQLNNSIYKSDLTSNTSEIYKNSPIIDSCERNIENSRLPFDQSKDMDDADEDLVSIESEIDLDKWQEQVDEMTEEQLLEKLRQINLKRVTSGPTYIEPIERPIAPLYKSKCYSILTLDTKNLPLKASYRKHDPVTLFHEHQARWKKDRFLNRLEKRAGKWIPPF